MTTIWHHSHLYEPVTLLPLLIVHLVGTLQFWISLLVGLYVSIDCFNFNWKKCLSQSPLESSKTSFEISDLLQIPSFGNTITTSLDKVKCLNYLKVVLELKNVICIPHKFKNKILSLKYVIQKDKNYEVFQWLLVNVL